MCTLCSRRRVVRIARILTDQRLFTVKMGNWLHDIESGLARGIGDMHWDGVQGRVFMTL